MTKRRLIGSVALLALLTLATAGARAEGEGKYPDWGGQWFRAGGIQFDPTKPLGRGQLQSARDRDPLHEGPAHVLRERTAAARGQPDGRQGAHLPRQGEARPSL